MALSGSTVVTVLSGGSDTNSGGFVTGAIGTDYSQQNSPQIAVTDAVTSGTTTIVSATAGFVAGAGGHTGNLIYMSGGTGSVVGSWYQVVSVTNTTTIVVDRATGLTTGTGATLNLGGALLTPGAVGPIFALGAAGISGWWKTPGSTLTTATPGPGGPVSLPSGFACRLEGYDVARGDRTGNRPVLTWPSSGITLGSATYACVAVAGALQSFANIAVNGNSLANACGINVGSVRTFASQCAVSNCNGTNGVGLLVSNSYNTTQCVATNCGIGFNSVGGTGVLSFCYATGCTTGFMAVYTAINCIAYNNTNGFGASGTVYINCVADANTVSGFISATQTNFVNCVASNHSGGSGIGYSVGTNFSALTNCAAWNNTTNVSITPQSNEGFITLTASPYPGSGNYQPNNTAGGGALLRGKGIGVFGQTDNRDIGAVQHADPTGGGAALLLPIQVGF